MPRPALARAYRPPGIVRDGLMARYRFDEGSGTAVNDSSGNGRHGTLGIAGVGLPTRTARGLSFNQSTVSLPLKWGTDIRTMTFAVSCAPGLLGQPLLSFNGTDATPRLAPGTCQVCWGAYPGEAVKGASPLRGWNVVSVMLTNPARVFINGREDVSYPTFFTSGLGAAGDNKLYLGSINGAAQASFAGEMGYFAAHARFLTPSEHARNADAIARELAMRGIAIGNTWPPDSDAIACVGDSLTDGVGVTSLNANAGYPYQLSSLLANPVPIANLGLSGQFAQTIQGTTGTFATMVKPWLAGYSGRKLVVLWCGTNDILNNAQTPAAIYGFVKAIGTAAKALGCSVLALDCLPRIGFPAAGTLDNNRLAFNASLAADNPTHVSGLLYTGASWCDALYTVSAEPNLSDCTNLAYFASDNTHLTFAGYAVVAGGVQAGAGHLGFH